RNRGHRRCSDRHGHVATGPCPPATTTDSFQNDMNHDEIRELIHAHVDGELDLVNAREVEQHIRGCDEGSRAEGQIRMLHEELSNSAPAYRAPTHLRRNIRKALRREDNVSEGIFSSWLTLATSAALAIAVLGFVLFQTMRPSQGNKFVD